MLVMYNNCQGLGWYIYISKINDLFYLQLKKYLKLQ